MSTKKRRLATKLLTLPLCCALFTSISAYGEGVIKGRIFHDKNENGKQDRREKPLRGVRVYIDENNNFKRDKNEPRTKTNRKGYFKFKGLEPGDYAVRQEMKFGWRNATGGDPEVDSRYDVIKESPDSAESITFTKRPAENFSEDYAYGGDYPFLLALEESLLDGENAIISGVDNNSNPLCAAAIISSRWLVTTSHCLDNVAKEDLRVKVLDYKRNKQFYVAAKDVVLHPKVSKGEVDPEGFGSASPTIGKDGFDIALVELKAALDLKGLGLQSIDMLSKRKASRAAEGAMATFVGLENFYFKRHYENQGENPTIFNLNTKYHAKLRNIDECVGDINDVGLGIFSLENAKTQKCADQKSKNQEPLRGKSLDDAWLVRDERRSKWLLGGFLSHAASQSGFFDIDVVDQDEAEKFELNEPDFYSNMTYLSSWVKKTAREKSNTQLVTVKDEQVQRVVFGNKKTRYTRRSRVAPRWQLNDSKVEQSENALLVNFNLVVDDIGSHAFECELDFDNAGPLSPVVFPCAAGANSFSIDTDGLEGVFVPELIVKSGETFINRLYSYHIFGNPEPQTITGSLSEGDFYQEENPENFCGVPAYYDVYDIEPLVDTTQPVVIRGTSENPESLYLALYKINGDVLDALDQGGELDGFRGGLRGLTYDGGLDYDDGIAKLDFPGVNFVLEGGQTKKFSVLVYNYFYDPEVEKSGVGDYTLEVLGATVTQRQKRIPVEENIFECF